MPPRKFKIGDVVRVKGDRKLARVIFANKKGGVQLDRPLKGFLSRQAADLILVRARPTKKSAPRKSKKA